MSTRFQELLGILEGVDIVSLFEDPSALAEAMTIRRETLEQLKLEPLSAVPESERDALRTRVEQLLRRDADTMQLLQGARLDVGEQLNKLVSGRAAARSYGGFGEDPSGSVKRTG